MIKNVDIFKKSYKKSNYKKKKRKKRRQILVLSINYYPIISNAVCVCGLGVGHGYLSMAVLFSSIEATLIEEQQQ